MKRSQVVFLVLAALVVLAVVGLSVYLAQNEPDTISVGYMRIAAHLPLIAAEKMQSFEDHKLKVRLEQYADTPSLMKAVEAGRVDVGFQLTPDIVWKSAASDKRYYIYFVATSTKDAPIDGFYSLNDNVSADSLRRKKIGCFPGPTSLAMTKQILSGAFGLAEGEYELVETPPPLQLTNLKSGEISALFTYEPLGTLAMERIGAKQVIRAPVEQYVVNPWHGGVGVFTEDLVERRPAVAKAFQSAIEEAVSRLKDNTMTAAQMLAELQPGLDSETAAKVPLTTYIFAGRKEENEALSMALEKQLSVYKSLGILPGEGRYNLMIFSGEEE